MAGVFPPSGVPASDAYNSLPNPLVAPNCDSLWYSTSRCTPRFDPSAANAVLSEIINLVNCSGEIYDCFKLDNLCNAVNYIVQRGQPHSGLMFAGPSAYLMTLDPPALSYTDYMSLIVVPQVDNVGPSTVTVAINGLAPMPIVRNDGQALRSLDLKAGKPALIAFYQGKFYVVGLVASQVPIVLSNSIDLWVRPDGNDTTGDGSSNSASKAFRTINRAFASFASRYAASPGFAINIRLGIPGDYDAAQLFDCNNQVNIIGDVNNYAAYRILSNRYTTVPLWCSCVFASRVNVYLQGITIVLDNASLWCNGLITGSATNVSTYNVRYETPYSLTSHTCIWMNGYLNMQGLTQFIGMGKTINAWLRVNTGDARSYEEFVGVSNLASYYFENMNFAMAGLISSHNGAAALQTNSLQSVNCTGSRYTAQMNGTIDHWKTLPGSTAGTLATGGQYMNSVP